jgi:hypothetical protein
LVDLGAIAKPHLPVKVRAEGVQGHQRCSPVPVVPEEVEYHLLSHMLFLVRKGYSDLPYATGRDAGLEEVHGKVKEAHDTLQLVCPEQAMEMGCGLSLVQLECPFSQLSAVFFAHNLQSWVGVAEYARQGLEIYRI